MMQQTEPMQKSVQGKARDAINSANIEAKEGKYLAFALDKEDYGIRILKVREIIGMMPITAVPQTPDFVLGVVNLRGKVIPVIDLRLRFGMPYNEYNERTCIVVVEFEHSVGAIPMGIVVDSVSEVFHIKENDIEDTPAFGVKLNTDFILGMAKINNSIKILLDIDRVLNSRDLEGPVQQDATG